MGEKKKQQKALQRRTERKEVRRRASITDRLNTLVFRQAGNYPIEGCWIRPDWREGGLTVLVLARRQPDGNLVFGVYMVDYYCLGLKDTCCRADVPPGEFRRKALPQILDTEQPLAISPAGAHEMIYGGIEYAAQYGFEPHADFKLSQYLLDPPDRHPRSGAIEFGYKGKPLYIQGPRDNPEAIVRQLLRTAGEGNFDYLVEVPGQSAGWGEEPE